MGKNLTRYMAGRTQSSLMALILKDDGIGVTQSCISHWLKRGVPRKRRGQLQRVSKEEMSIKALEKEWKKKKFNNITSKISIQL